MLTDTVILLGNSPFIATIEDKVQYVLERYYSIGINSIINKYKTNEHIFQDMWLINTTNKFPEIKTVTQYLYGSLIQKDKKELYDSFSFDFEKNTEKDTFMEGRLAWCGFTHDYALSYCIHKGYKRVILIGVADFIEGGHYVTDGEFKYSNVLKHNSINFINNIIPKSMNIYTCNPSSPLSIPYLSIDELLK